MEVCGESRKRMRAALKYPFNIYTWLSSLMQRIVRHHIGVFFFVLLSFLCVSCRSFHSLYLGELIKLVERTRTIDAWMAFMCANRDDDVLYLILTRNTYFAIIGANVFYIPKGDKLPISQMRSGS